jgi:hypothetical protein
VKGDAADVTGDAENVKGDSAKSSAAADRGAMSERSVPSARLSGYQEEAAQLLAGGAGARRKRRTTTASGLPAPDPADQEPPIKLTRPPRRGQSKPPAKD